MSSLYAMQRANGDWFALDDRGRFRVPLFSSRQGGLMARVGNWGMRLFKPVALDERALAELVAPDGASEKDFWLVEDPFTNLSRGRLIDCAQLSLLVQDAA
jgi:hypothetical protein